MLLYKTGSSTSFIGPEPLRGLGENFKIRLRSGEEASRSNFWTEMKGPRQEIQDLH